MDAVWRQLQNPDGPAPHPVTPPAEDDGVDSSREDSLQQHLSLFLMKQPAKDEMHQAGRMYRESADKTRERQLRNCETASGGLDSVDLCRQDEVVFGQPTRRVGPEHDLQRAIGEVEVRVVAFGLGDRGYPVD